MFYEHRAPRATGDRLQVLGGHRPGAALRRRGGRPARDLQGESRGDQSRVETVWLYKAGPEIAAGQCRIGVRSHGLEAIEEPGGAVEAENAFSGIEHEGRMPQRQQSLDPRWIGEEPSAARERREQMAFQLQ